MSVLGGLGPTIIAVMWLEQILAFAFVGLRLVCRTSLTAKSAKGGADDILMVISTLLMLGYTAFCTAAALNGFGQHFADLELSQFITANKLEIIGQTFCIIGIATSKAAVAAFQMRIYTKQWHMIVLWMSIVGVSGICFFTALFDFVRCSPVEAVWNPTITDAVCFVSTGSFTYLSVSLSVICSFVDFVYAILPWVALWNLQMPKNTKLVICSAMSLSIFAGICGIVRAVNLLGLNARSDYSYETVGLILWSSTELLVTIMTACIPCYRELWKRIFNKHGSSGSGSNSYFQNKSIRLQDKDMRTSRSRMDYTSGAGKVETQIYYGEGDDRSDRGILDNNHSMEGVKVTSDVVVSVETTSHHGDSKVSL